MANGKIEISELGKAFIEIISLNFVEKEVAENRLDVCRNCPNDPPMYDDGWCKECVCKMKIKTKLINFNCPFGHW